MAVQIQFVFYCGAITESKYAMSENVANGNGTLEWQGNGGIYSICVLLWYNDGVRLCVGGESVKRKQLFGVDIVWQVNFTSEV